MGSAKDIVRDLSRLIGSTDELLQTQTAQQAPAIAQELGAESQLNQAIDFLAGLLGKIKSELAKMRDPLLYIGALSGLVGLIRPFVNAVDQLISTSGEQLTKAGLGEVVKVTDQISEGVALGSNVLKGGQEVLDNVPLVADLDELLNKLGGLASTLEARKAPAA